mgnify:CR=1 FL=1
MRGVLLGSLFLLAQSARSEEAAEEEGVVESKTLIEAVSVKRDHPVVQGILGETNTP